MPADIAPFVNDTTHFRRAVADFPGCLTADLTDALHRHAREFLEGQGVNGEPPVWQPPTSLLNGLHLPGLNPDDVDGSFLREFPAGTARVSEIADELGISIDAARYCVEMHPARSLHGSGVQCHDQRAWARIASRKPRCPENDFPTSTTASACRWRPSPLLSGSARLLSLASRRSTECNCASQGRK